MIPILVVAVIAVLAYNCLTKSQFTEDGPTWSEVQSRILNKTKQQ